MNSRRREGHKAYRGWFASWLNLNVSWNSSLGSFCTGMMLALEDDAAATRRRPSALRFRLLIRDCSISTPSCEISVPHIHTVPSPVTPITVLLQPSRDIQSERLPTLRQLVAAPRRCSFADHASLPAQRVPSS